MCQRQDCELDSISTLKAFPQLISIDPPDPNIDRSTALFLQEHTRIESLQKQLSSLADGKRHETNRLVVEKEMQVLRNTLEKRRAKLKSAIDDFIQRRLAGSDK